MRAKSLIRDYQPVKTRTGLKKMQPTGKLIATRHASAVAEIIGDEWLDHWRSLYDATASAPSRADVCATLQDLTAIPDSDAAAALALIDAGTEGALLRGAYYWRKLFGTNPDVCDPATLREVAQLALKHIPATSGGRPKLLSLHIKFATAIAIEYQRQYKKPPTVITGGFTEFMQFAHRAFECATRRSYRRLPDAILTGVRGALQRQKSKRIRGNKAFRTDATRIGFWGI